MSVYCVEIPMTASFDCDLTRIWSHNNQLRSELRTFMAVCVTCWQVFSPPDVMQTIVLQKSNARTRANTESIHSLCLLTQPLACEKKHLPGGHQDDLCPRTSLRSLRETKCSSLHRPQIYEKNGNCKYNHYLHVSWYMFMGIVKKQSYSLLFISFSAASHLS